jgi:hypothetical protein
MSTLTLQRSGPKQEDRQSTFIIVCAWCGRERHRSAWRTLRVPRIGKRADISHGICPDCYARQIAKLHEREQDH